MKISQEPFYLVLESKKVEGDKFRFTKLKLPESILAYVNLKFKS